VRVFLRSASGMETRVDPMQQLGDHPEALGFAYDPVTGIVRMTHAACDMVANQHQQVVVRYNHARLIE